MAERDGKSVQAIVADQYAELVSLSNQTQDTCVNVHDVFTLPEAQDFMLTGFDDWDKYGGLPLTTSLLVCGVTGFGKSLFGLNLLMNMYELNNEAVAYFTVERSKEEVQARMWASLSGVDFIKIFTGMLNPDEKLLVHYHKACFRHSPECHEALYQEIMVKNKEKYKVAFDNQPDVVHKYLIKKFPVRESKFIVIDNSGLNINDVELKVDAMVKNDALKVFCIDHLHRMSRTENKEDNHVALGKISDDIATLALRHRIISVVLAQSNKENSMAANSKAVEHSPTVIMRINPEEALREACVMKLECAKARGIKFTGLTFSVNPDIMLLSNLDKPY